MYNRNNSHDRLKFSRLFTFSPSDVVDYNVVDFSEEKVQTIGVFNV